MKRIKWNEGGGGIKSGKRHEDTCTLLVYAVSVFTVYWEKQLTGCQVQPGLQNLCDHLLPPLWPSDTRIYTSIYMYECVCVCVCVCGCVRVHVCAAHCWKLFSMCDEGDSKEWMQDLSPCRQPLRGVRHVTGPVTWLFSLAFIQMSCVTVDSESDKKDFKKKCSGAACYTCFPSPPSAPCSTRRSRRPAWAQRSRQF